MRLIPHHEFWPSWVLLTPYVGYIMTRALTKGISPYTLMKADYALDHGDVGLRSKYKAQKAFEDKFFPPTELLLATDKNKKTKVATFAKKHGFPIVIKSDLGETGKAVVRVCDNKDFAQVEPNLYGDFLIQKYVDEPHEYGVFYARQDGKSRILSINGKKMPELIGDGVSSIDALAKKHPRYSMHWNAFLVYHDQTKVLQKGEKLSLSFIGSHTLGSVFTDESHLATPELLKKLDSIFAKQPGFNFGRLDVKVHSEKDLMQGKFVVIEINGIASLPTNLFDPKYSLRESYNIFFDHANALVDIAKEHRKVAMHQLPIHKLLKGIIKAKIDLNKAHKMLFMDASHAALHLK